MSAEFASLNRCQMWSSDQKKVYRKLFTQAKIAAAALDSSSINRSFVHTTLAGKLDASEEQDLRSLFNGLRVAIDAQDVEYDTQPHFTADRYTGNKRRIVKDLVQTCVLDVVAANVA